MKTNKIIVLKNLEWCTAKYNSNYGTRTERSSKNRWKPVFKISEDGRILDEYSSIKEASELNDINRRGITHAISDKYPNVHRAGGYKWKAKY